jgi:hypothetical protein
MMLVKWLGVEIDSIYILGSFGWAWFTHHGGSVRAVAVTMLSGGFSCRMVALVNQRYCCDAVVC